VCASACMCVYVCVYIVSASTYICVCVCAVCVCERVLCVCVRAQLLISLPAPMGKDEGVYTCYIYLSILGLWFKGKRCSLNELHTTYVRKNFPLPTQHTTYKNLAQFRLKLLQTFFFRHVRHHLHLQTRASSSSSANTCVIIFICRHVRHHLHLQTRASSSSSADTKALGCV
jgi:hypothetical protein